MLPKERSELKDSIDKLEEEVKSLQPISVNKCRKGGCCAGVFCDYTTEFPYCSPFCRNEDVLTPSSLKLLESAIKELEQSYSGKIYLLVCLYGLIRSSQCVLKVLL